MSDDTKKKGEEIREGKNRDTGRRVSVKALFALIFYLVMPVAVIFIIMESYPELSKERYENILKAIIPVSIAMVILSQLSIRYPKGDWRRLAYNMAYVATCMLWLIAFLGGSMVITQNWGEYEFSLHLEKYVLLILIVTLFNCLYYFLEYVVYANSLEEAINKEKSGEEGEEKAEGLTPSAPIQA